METIQGLREVDQATSYKNNYYKYDNSKPALKILKVLDSMKKLARETPLISWQDSLFGCDLQDDKFWYFTVIYFLPDDKQEAVVKLLSHLIDFFRNSSPRSTT
jgi:hypothetical protein